MQIPVCLKHKPVVVVENYDKIDGQYTDAKGLSLGLAQWNERGNVDISAKVWRHTGEKWSRQSEEMPLHRVLDLTILICQTMKYFSDRSSKNDVDKLESPIFDKIKLQDTALPVAFCTENELINEDMKLFEKCLHKDKEILAERLLVLASFIKKLKL